VNGSHPNGERDADIAAPVDEFFARDRLGVHIEALTQLVEREDILPFPDRLVFEGLLQDLQRVHKALQEDE